MVFETSESLCLLAGEIMSHMFGLVVLGLTLVKMVHACMHVCMHKGSRDADACSYHSPLENVLPESPYDVALL